MHALLDGSMGAEKCPFTSWDLELETSISATYESFWLRIGLPSVYSRHYIPYQMSMEGVTAQLE